MPVKNVLAGVAVRDLDVSTAWYEKLLGRPADSQPMAEVTEWKFPGGGCMQVFQDLIRAGSSSLTLAVSDLDGEVATLKANGITVGRRTSSEKVNTAMVADPDGNRVMLAEALAGDVAG